MAPSDTQAVVAGTNHNGNTRCPACGHRGDPVIVSTSSPSALTIFIIIALCLSCVCCLLGGVRVSTLAFYCERCGLRLITEDNASSQVKYDDSNLIPWPPEAEIPSSVRQAPSLKAASSPLGLPTSVHRPYIINIKTRYRDLEPVQILNIETGSFKLPCKATSTTQPAISYLIESPGIPPLDQTSKPDPQYLQTHCAWSYGFQLPQQAPHFRVSIQSNNGSAREVAQVRLFGGTDWNAEIRLMNRNGTEVDSSVGKPSSEKPCNTRQMLAADEAVWNNSHTGILWTSTEGLMLWSERKIEDGSHVKGNMLCLLDAYDRLLLALWKTGQPGGQRKTWQMRVYVDLAEDFLGEIIASYTTLRCQRERIRQEHMFDSS